MKKIVIAWMLSCLISAVSEAATYYVAKTGSNSYSCAQAQSQSTPKLSIGAGLSCLATGDRLEIKGGTYSEAIAGGASWPYAAGSSWTNAITITRFGSDVVTVRGPFTFWGSSARYIVLDRIIVDATGYGEGVTIGGGANHIKVINSEIKNALHQGLTCGDDNIIADTSIHDNGTVAHFDHGVYCGGARNLFERNKVYNNAAFGFHFYNSGLLTVNGNIVRNNILYGNSRLGGSDYQFIFSNGDGNIAYNNIIRNSSCAGFIVYGATNTRIYNNTIYNNSGGAGIEISSNSTGTIVRNNIVYENAAGIVNAGSSSVISNNLTTNPMFKDGASGDLSLQTGSLAIDTGVAISDVSYDINGGARPQGCCYDVGAYEFGSSSSTSSGWGTGVVPGVTVDSSYSGYTSSPVNDGIINASGGTATTWASEDSSADHWINIAFSSPQSINTATIYWAYNNFQQKYMTSQKVYVQHWDGSAYQTVATVNYTGSDLPLSSVSFSPVSTTQLRFYQPSNQGNPTYPGVFWITEVKHGSVPSPSPPTNVVIISY